MTMHNCDAYHALAVGLVAFLLATIISLALQHLVGESLIVFLTYPALNGLLVAAYATLNHECWHMYAAALFIGLPAILASSVALAAAHESDIEPIIPLVIYYAIALFTYTSSYLIIGFIV
jgi:hypothetical protein